MLSIRGVNTMMAMLGTLVITASFVGCPGANLNLNKETFTCEGRTRTYHFRVPSDYDGTTPLPVVLVLHGFGGTGPIAAASTGFAELADAEQFVAVFPSGLQRRWRYDGASTHSDAVDDVAFLKAVVQRLGHHVVVDRARVYVTGFSNGGFMTLTLECVAPETFAAVAAVAGGVGTEQELQCHLERRVPTLLIHGTDDTFVPYDGGTVQMGPGRELALRSAPEVAALLAERNGCMTPLEETVLPDVDPQDGTRVTELKYACDPSAEVLLYRVQGGGHTWPGGKGILGRRFVGPTSRDIEASRLIWDFFQRHAQP